MEIFNQVSRLEFEAFQFPRFDKRVQFLFHKEMFLAFDKDLSGEITFDEYLAYQVSLKFKLKTVVKISKMCNFSGSRCEIFECSRIEDSQ